MNAIDKQITKSTARFLAKMMCTDMTDAEIRIAIKAMRDVLLQRQQERATKRFNERNNHA